MEEPRQRTSAAGEIERSTETKNMSTSRSTRGSRSKRRVGVPADNATTRAAGEPYAEDQNAVAEDATRRATGDGFSGDELCGAPRCEGLSRDARRELQRPSPQRPQACGTGDAKPDSDTFDVLLFATGFETAAAYVGEVIPLMKQAGEKNEKMGAFRVDRSYLLQNGLQEFLLEPGAPSLPPTVSGPVHRKRPLKRA